MRIFLNKNLFATPHIAGHSQFARYQMTKMAYENVMNFLGQDISERNSILENRIINFEKNIFDKDMKEFGLPVSLMLETYNPKSDVFNYKDFKKVRDNYNHRIGYSQVTIKGCSSNYADREIPKITWVHCRRKLEYNLKAMKKINNNLTEEELIVLRDKGTERAFSGKIRFIL